MQFNTAIARLMELTNAINKYLQEETKNPAFLKDTIADFVKLLAPFAPHFAEEEWSLLGSTSTIFNERLPEFDPSALVKDEVEIAIQINGKIKAKIMVASNLDEEGIKAASLENETIKENTEGKAIIKVIVIKGRLVNIVVK
jgi:leucyl-tRNA synthetase